MCGIFGIINFSEKIVSRNDLMILSDNMIHRGPDDSGIFISNNISIGMRRLSIIDLSNGQQPMYNEDKSICLVFNGEIYNYKELRVSLRQKGYNFRTESDVEVLIYLYQEYGRKCIQMINGMFAFALIDLKKNILWVARDRLGIKPLFFCKKEDSFYFSSELSGLAKVTKNEISYTSILNYLACSYIEAPKSIYKNIYKLMPGEEIILNLENYQLNRNIYWKIENFENAGGSIKYLKEELDFLISDAIKMQMRSDVPVGLFLSGGIDSSAISIYASKIIEKQQLNTFTINFKDKISEDYNFAKEISSKINSNHNEILATPKTQIESLNDLIDFMDEPMSDSAIVPTYMIAKKASEHGMKVMLSGAGADEIFAGYNRHFPGKIGSAAWISNLPQSYKPLLLKFLALKNSSYRHRFVNSARNFASNISGLNYSFLDEGLIKKDSFQLLLKNIDNSFELTNPNDSYDLMHLDVTNYLPNNILMLTDQATMSVSIEGRVPFLDHRIVEFAFSIPKNKNLYNGNSKGLLKNTFQNMLPKKLLHRKKEGFNAPIHSWINMWPKLIKDELIGNLNPILSNIIDKNVISKWINTDKYRKDSANSLYALYVLNIWLRKKHF